MFFAKNIGSFDARQHQYFSTSRLCIRCFRDWRAAARWEPVRGNGFEITASLSKPNTDCFDIIVKWKPNFFHQRCITLTTI